MKTVHILPVLLLTGFSLYKSDQAVPSTQLINYSPSGSMTLLSPAQDTAKVPYVREGDTKKKKKKADKVPASKATKVTYTRGVGRASLTRRTEDGHHVEIVVVESGMKMRTLDDLQLVGSSGSQLAGNNLLGFDNIELPFEGFIRFKAINKMNSAIYDREVRFVVKDPGRWVLKIDL